MSLRWSHRPFCWFCHIAAHVVIAFSQAVAEKFCYKNLYMYRICGPRRANLVLIAYASSEGSGEPAHPGSLARISAARSYKQ